MLVMHNQQEMLSRAGFVCLELYKVVQAVPMERYRNTFANLALPLFAMSEPMPSKVRSLPAPSLDCCASAVSHFPVHAVSKSGAAPDHLACAGCESATCTWL